MHYKILYIVIITSSIFSQSFFNRIIPGELYLGDARSMAIAKSALSTNNNSAHILSNPAILSNNFDGIYIDSNFGFKSIFERRSIIFKDEWDEALGETDYAFNQNNYFDSGFGITYTKSFGKFRFAGAAMQKPFLSLNYNYEEEIRGDSNLDDGIIGINDPIVGYQNYSTSATVDIRSIGFSFAFNSTYKRDFSFGIGLNSIVDTKLKDNIKLIVIDDSYGLENMSLINDLSNSYSISAKNYFHTFGIQIPLSDIFVLSLSYEEGAVLSSSSSTSSVGISNIVGLPQLFGYVNQELSYLADDFMYRKPEKNNLGFIYSPKSNINMLITFEAVNSFWEVSGPGLDNNIFEYKIGFEYSPYQSYPIRAGLVYSESPFSIIEPASTLTLGTGKKIGRFEFDVAMNYSTIKYKYFDIFPLEDIYSLSCEDIGCDNVTENKLSFLTTLKIGF